MSFTVSNTAAAALSSPVHGAHARRSSPRASCSLKKIGLALVLGPLLFCNAQVAASKVVSPAEQTSLVSTSTQSRPRALVIPFWDEGRDWEVRWLPKVPFRFSDHRWLTVGIWTTLMTEL